MTLTEIADDIAAHADVDAQAALTRMSAETVDVQQDIVSADIKEYLMLTDRWLPIKDAANRVVAPVDSARLAMDALATFETFQITHTVTGGMVLGKLGQILDALITDGLLAAQDKAAVLAMGSRTDPKWPGIDIGKVQDALRARSEGAI